MATARRITVPIEAKDLVSGTLRRMQGGLRNTQDDVGGLRRAADRMGQEFSSSIHRAGESARDLGARVGQAADETRQLGRAVVGDLFRRARSSAEAFRRTVSGADRDVKEIPNAHVRLHADDQISPLIDNISTKLSALAALGSGLVLGGGMSDAIFGGVGDYYKEASRLAPYLSSQQRSDVLATNDQLVAQGLISDRATGAAELSTLTPMVQDKSQVSEAFAATTKLQSIIPDSESEEMQRAVTQSAKNFKESYSQVADSIAHAYMSVGDPQKDIADTFWEYSPYFASSGTSSAQMSNFLSSTVKEGAFNFDKPGDFFKEVFGVKALNADDMADYFGARGSGKKEAARQADAFTADINSGDTQRAKGAIAALLADMASQDRNELKQTLTKLGSATGEDNADAILKTYGVAFEKAPDMTGTTDRMVKQQQEADPMTAYRQSQADIQMQMQDIGGNIMQASVPAMKEFNSLLTDNKAQIEALGSGLAAGISNIVSFYHEFSGVINKVVVGLAGILALKGAVGIIKGTKQLIQDMGSVGKLIWKAIPGKKGLGGGLTPIGGADFVSSMNVNATSVYINGNIGGNSRRGKGKGKDKGKGKGGKSGSSNKTSVVSNKNKTEAVVSKKDTVKGKDTKVTTKTPKQPKTPKFSPKIGADALLSTGVKSVGGATKGVLKGLGVLGTIANVGMSAYDMYGIAKEQGWKEALSTNGGSTAGSLIGGGLGGALGTIAGPLGTALGAAAGSWVGEKLGSLADSSGVTRDIVDCVSNLTSSIKDWMGFGPKEEPKPVTPQLPKESFITTTSTTTKEGEKKIKETMDNIVSHVQKSGLKQGIKDAMDDSDIVKSADKFKDIVVGMFKGSDSKEAESNVKAVGKAAKETEKQAKDLGVTSKNSTKDIISSNSQAALSFSGVSSSAKSAIDLTRRQLESLSTISSKGSTWGSNLISMMASGMLSQIPTLTSAVSNAAKIMHSYLGFSSPTKEGPASKSDKWAPNFVSMFSDGLRSDSIKNRMDNIAGTMRDGVDGIEGASLSSGSIPVRTSPLSAEASSGNKSVTIGNVTIDLSGVAAGITDFQSFARALTSPAGRALIRDVAGEEIYKALETGG
ncbi:tail tape measure protein [Paenibacillus sp. AN1007]|uniref:Tail tape measure protein n=1 Tax=Paenibacillus sp. AN1007 TaxID=3151385 RepID=A0AAU8NEL6_9BACL